MTEDEAVAKLDALTGGDAEIEHSLADDVLLELVPEAVAAAWDRARTRIGFWYA